MIRRQPRLGNIERGLGAMGFSAADVAAITGENWLRFFDESSASVERD